MSTGLVVSTGFTGLTLSVGLVGIAGISGSIANIFLVSYSKLTEPLIAWDFTVLANSTRSLTTAVFGSVFTVLTAGACVLKLTWMSFTCPLVKLPKLTVLAWVPSTVYVVLTFWTSSWAVTRITAPCSFSNTTALTLPVSWAGSVVTFTSFSALTFWLTLAVVTVVNAAAASR